jgi:hypothetical protein
MKIVAEKEDARLAVALVTAIEAEDDVVVRDLIQEVCKRRPSTIVHLVAWILGLTKQTLQNGETLREAIARMGVLVANSPFPE